MTKEILKMWMYDMIKDSRRSENIGIMSKRQKGVLIELTYKLHSQIMKLLRNCR